MLKVMYGLIAASMLMAIISIILTRSANAPGQGSTLLPPEEKFCTMDAMECPDGSYVGRTGPSCEFECPQVTPNTSSIQLNSPKPQTIVSSPLQISGEAKGTWYFEGSFPVYLVDWDGLIIAEGVATAQSEWMTESLVPFTANLIFISPYSLDEQDFMSKGALILRKDNPSGLPENDEVLEIPILFAPIS